jgi:RNA polymerase sigma factor (sigma-70 family)
VSTTRTLLQRWHAGDADALAELVAQDREWVEGHVRARLGALLRAREDTQDIVQNTMVEILRYGPRFVLSDRGHLRGLLARMVESVLRGQAQRWSADKRDVRREARPVSPAASDTVLDLDLPGPDTQPTTAAMRSETRDWVRLALALLEPEDRLVVVWRDYEELSFVAIAQRLTATEDGVRMRHKRALAKLANKLRQLRAGELVRSLES